MRPKTQYRRAHACGRPAACAGFSGCPAEPAPRRSATTPVRVERPCAFCVLRGRWPVPARVWACARCPCPPQRGRPGTCLLYTSILPAKALLWSVSRPITVLSSPIASPTASVTWKLYLRQRPDSWAYGTSSSVPILPVTMERWNVVIVRTKSVSTTRTVSIPAPTLVGS